MDSFPRSNESEPPYFHPKVYYTDRATEWFFEGFAGIRSTMRCRIVLSVDDACYICYTSTALADFVPHSFITLLHIRCVSLNIKDSHRPMNLNNTSILKQAFINFKDTWGELPLRSQDVIYDREGCTYILHARILWERELERRERNGLVQDRGLGKDLQGLGSWKLEVGSIPGRHWHRNALDGSTT